MNAVRRALAGVALATLVANPACKPKPPIPVVKRPDGTVVDAPPKVGEAEEAAAHALAAEAKALDGSDPAAAQHERDRLVEEYPGTLAGALELESRATTADTSDLVPDAIELYERLLFYRPTFERVDDIRERYAELLLEVRRYEDAAQNLDVLFAGASDAQMKARFGVPLARALTRSGQARRALDINVELRDLDSLSDEQRMHAERTAIDIIGSGLSFREAEELWDDVENDSDWAFAQPLIAFKLAKVQYHTRNYKKAHAMLEVVRSRYPKTEYAQQAATLLERLDDRFRVESKRVGVLLPLSGRYGRFGERALAAVRLVFKEGGPYELVIKDTKGDPTATSGAVESLVHDHHAIAIIGPLFSKTALAASLKAEELSVPILSLSFRKDLPQLGPYVFRTALTVEAQARAIAKVAFEELGMSRFAVLYPRSQYGQRFLAAFWDEVDRRKGEIRGLEAYEHDETTFSQPVKKLVGRHYRMSRWDYHDFLRKLRQKHLPPHRFRAAVEKFEKGMPPIVDFDAIVIPDSSKKIGLIAPAIAFEDIVLTRKKKELETIKKALGYKEVNPVTLLGGSGWNSIETINTCGRYCEHAIFVDAYYPDNPSPKVRDFVSAFREATGSEPMLTDAQAFDTAGLLQWILKADHPGTRMDLRDALLKMRGFEGVTGAMTFDADGEARKDLFVLTIEDETIRKWERPAEPPKG